MNTRIFEAFDAREKQVAEYMAGCGIKYGMPCTCGDGCRCRNCTEHCKQRQEEQQQSRQDEQKLHEDDQNYQVDSPENGNYDYGWTGSLMPLCGTDGGDAMRVASRNPSVVSYGNGRHMSITSETTFGRAMSGLSALSIDWENMEDFDITVDHSSHIDNTLNPVTKLPHTDGDVVMKRSSLRRSFVSTAVDPDGAHVSFKV
jgi:hypothetical protein